MTRTCPVGGESLEGRQRNAVYCSGACRAEASRAPGHAIVGAAALVAAKHGRRCETCRDPLGGRRWDARLCSAVAARGSGGGASLHRLTRLLRGPYVPCPTVPAAIDKRSPTTTNIHTENTMQTKPSSTPAGIVITTEIAAGAACFQNYCGFNHAESIVEGVAVKTDLKAGGVIIWD